MKNLSKLILLLSLCSLATLAVAQDEEDPSRKYKKKDLDQLQQYEDGDYLFPPKPKNNFSVGVKGGLGLLFGDVRPENGWAALLDIRKALGNAFSFRLQGGIGSNTGLNYEQSQGYNRHRDNPWDINYGVASSDPNTIPNVFYNYRMSHGELSAQALWSMNNVNFYTEQNRWNIYVGAGVGVMGYNTKVDALDAQGDPYEFDNIDLNDLNNRNTTRIDDKRNRLDQLQSLLDGEYESEAEAHRDRQTLSVGDDIYTLSFFGVGVMGTRYRLNRRVELELEYRFVVTGDDLLDGQRWQEFGRSTQSQTVATAQPDALSTFTLGIHFRIGSKAAEDALWWNNPLSQLYSDAQDVRQIVKMLSEDSDNDGITDMTDKEPDTPEGVPVDALGRALDSDKDGYHDDIDEEPFSPKGCDVDEYGVAVDSDNDGVPDCYDKEPNSEPGMYYDVNGVAIRIETTTNTETPCLLPIIHFELDRDAIKPEFYPEMYYISQVMKNDKSIKVRAVGYADARNTDAYNMDLSKRRVENAISFLVNTYGIEQNRFTMDFRGENDPMIKGLPENAGGNTAKLEPLYYVNRRVEFECVREAER